MHDINDDLVINEHFDSSFKNTSSLKLGCTIKFCQIYTGPLSRTKIPQQLDL